MEEYKWRNHQRLGSSGSILEKIIAMVRCEDNSYGEWKLARQNKKGQKIAIMDTYTLRQERAWVKQEFKVNGEAALGIKFKRVESGYEVH